MHKLLLATLALFAVMTTAPALAGDPNVSCVQEQLNLLGYDTGVPDGKMGGKTRSASEAYLVAVPQQSAVAPLAPETAKDWCELLAATSPELAAVAAARPDDVLLTGAGVDVRQRNAILMGLLEAHGIMQRRLGVVLERPVTAFASDDAKWLTDNYLKVRNLGENYRSGKMREFGNCEPAAEGGYYNMFLCMGSDAWKRSTMPSGSRDAEVMAIVTHEYMHDVQFGLVGERGKDCCTDSDAMSIFGPQWLVEGSAEYLRYVLMDELGHMSLEQFVNGTRKQLRGSDLNLLVRETRKGFRDGENSWQMGTLATHYLVSLSDFPALASFWEKIGEGAEMQDAFNTSFGRTTDAFALDFAKWVNPKISAKKLAEITAAQPSPAAEPTYTGSPVDYMACVQKQFRILGYYNGAVDGLISTAMTDGSKRYIAAKKNAGWNIPVLVTENAADWCKQLAEANPSVAQYWQEVH